MSWTKRDFIIAAFEEIGIASYQFDLQPEMLDLAKKRLDAMLAEWNAKGVRLGYPVSSSPSNGNLDDDTSVPDMANSAIYQNLALRIAPVFGKPVSADLKTSAFNGYNALITKNVEVPQMQFNRSVPAGQGNKLRRTYSPFLLPPDDNVTDTDGSIDFN